MKGREKIETTGDKRSKKGEKQEKSDRGKEMFWVWKFQPSGQSL